MKLLLLFLFTTSTIASEYTDFSLKRSDPENKGVFWGPLASFILPGANQWYEGQYAQARMYSGIALGGIFLAGSAGLTDEDLESMEEEGFDDSEDEKFRRYQLGGQIYQVAGGLSAYASFQSTVKYRKEKGEYGFIKKQETVQEIMAAPFDFSYLKRKTTYVPLATLLGLVLLSDGISTGEFGSSDAIYAGAFSYNAGTHEEGCFVVG